MPDTSEQEYWVIRQQIDALRVGEVAPPSAISLGTMQRASLEAYVRLITGQVSADPVVSVQGLPVSAAGGADVIALVP